MSRFLLRPSLTILRILILAGALASLGEFAQLAHPIRISLVSFNGAGGLAAGEHTAIQLALTAVALSLL